MGEFVIKALFAISFLILVALSIFAWAIQPRPNAHGRTPLIWVSDDNPSRAEQIDLFERQYPRYDITLDTSDLAAQKVIVQSIANVGPDLFDCYAPSQLSAYVKSGVAWDVTDELKRRGIDVDKEVWGVAKPYVMLDGRVYGFPTNAVSNALWYNKDIFDKAKLPYPHGALTWENFLPIAQKLTIRDQNGRVIQYGLLLDWYEWRQFVYQWGGRVFTPDGTRCVVDSPEAIAGLQFWHDLIYKYRVIPSPADEDTMASAGGFGSGTINLFKGGKGAAAVGGRWWLVTMRKEPGLRLGAMEVPFSKCNVNEGGGRSTLINKNSPYREQALDFLTYEHSATYNALVNHEADGVAPMIQYCDTNSFLHDKDYPAEDYNQTWRDAMKHAVSDQISPYANPSEVDRITGNQIQLIGADQKPVAEAMRDAATQINALIAKTIAEDPNLMARYAAARKASGQ